MGFIFYSLSKRMASVEAIKEALNHLPKTIKKVGVFVNETENVILEIAHKLSLDVIQLHGDESVELGKSLIDKGFQVWKAFGLKFEQTDWTNMTQWLDACDCFLFDTASEGYGGSGQKFNHHVLATYPFQKPFWLSGGIDLDFLTLPHFFDRLPVLGLDINSKFESQPGMKNLGAVETFIKHWKY